MGAGVIQGHSRQHYELMSIAVPPEPQRTGYGSALLEGIIAHCRRIGAQTLEVGTGTFGYQLAFYQRHGFTVSRHFPVPAQRALRFTGGYCLMASATKPAREG